MQTFGYLDTVTGKTYSGQTKNGNMVFNKPSLIDRISRRYKTIFKNKWVVVDSCLINLIKRHIDLNVHYNVDGILKIYKKQYTDDYCAEWGTPSDLRDIDFNYACQRLEKQTGRKVKL